MTVREQLRKSGRQAGPAVADRPDPLRGHNIDVDRGHDEEHEHEHRFTWPEGLRIGVVAVAAAAVWFDLWEPLPHVSVIGVLGVLVGGWPIYQEAGANILARRMTMELSMSIAIIAAPPRLVSSSPHW
jgi:Cd2+/Zn2+-exporting ATPase/Cu+-exporting ATPase